MTTAMTTAMKTGGGVMLNLPTVASDFTVEWLNAALTESGRLGAFRILDVDASDSDIPGQTAEIAKLVVEYDDPACPLPRTLIAKYTSRNQEVIERVVNVYQQYWRETSFYRELPDVGIAVPDCLYSAFDPEKQQFIILMADLTPSASPSWASTPEQVAMAVAHLPGMHAKWWNAPVLREKEWLVQFDNKPFYQAAAGAAATAVPRIREVFGEPASHTAELIEGWFPKIDKATDYIASRPFTLVHGDYHAKQLFFPTPAGGDFAVIDWQFSFVAQGAWDLIRIITLGQDIESRRAREQGLIEGYLKALKANGVSGYEIDDLKEDIKIGLIVNQMIMSVALIDTDISLFETECTGLGVDWKDVLLLRGEAAVRDWGVVEKLESL